MEWNLDYMRWKWRGTHHGYEIGEAGRTLALKRALGFGRKERGGGVLVGMLVLVIHG